MNAENKLLIIVPAKRAPGDGVHKTQGTKVITPLGEELFGVTEIRLTALPNDVWRASITCVVDAPDLFADCKVVHRQRKLSIWERLIGRTNVIAEASL